jgi:hypothetical protein
MRAWTKACLASKIDLSLSTIKKMDMILLITIRIWALTSEENEKGLLSDKLRSTWCRIRSTRWKLFQTFRTKLKSQRIAGQRRKVQTTQVFQCVSTLNYKVHRQQFKLRWETIFLKLLKLLLQQFLVTTHRTLYVWAKQWSFLFREQIVLRMMIMNLVNQLFAKSLTLILGNLIHQLTNQCWNQLFLSQLARQLRTTENISLISKFKRLSTTKWSTTLINELSLSQTQKQ